MRTAALLLVLAAARAVPAQNATDTRLLSQPAVSAAHMAFAYAGDLWSARLDGSDVRRLTIADGDESGPSFSPDGRHVLFTSGRDAWTGSHQQLFLVPVGGGVENSSPSRPRMPGRAIWRRSRRSWTRCSALAAT
jgi:tricorn protease